MVDPNLLTGFVDDINSRCPGTFKGKKLIKIGIQKQRRLFSKILFGRVKNIIYNLEGTRDIVYKEKNECHPGVVMMGLKGDTWQMHPKSVPMSVYAQAFLDKDHLIIELGTNSSDWLKRNDYELV